VFLAREASDLVKFQRERQCDYNRRCGAASGRQ
jgi:hypothetical protein